jgi:hypothetical protein
LATIKQPDIPRLAKRELAAVARETVQGVCFDPKSSTQKDLAGEWQYFLTINKRGRTYIGKLEEGDVLMPKATSKTASRISSKKKHAKKKSISKVLNCPVNGAGWCPYPFSIEQLEKHLRERALQQVGAASK